MKKLVIILLAIIPFLSFSQRAEKPLAPANKSGINWIPLEKAKVLARKHNQKILIFFYKKDCAYCETMKQKTLSDPTVIKIIHNNFLPVKIDSRTKETIIYNGVSYGNQQPASSGRHDWRHDFYAEVATFNYSGNPQITTPSIVLFNNRFEKISVIPGNKPKEHLLRLLKKYM